MSLAKYKVKFRDVFNKPYSIYMIFLLGIHGNMSLISGSTPTVTLTRENEYAEVTVVPVATAGPCNSSCHTIYPFLILLFLMTFIVAITQMPLLMIVLR